MLSVFLALGILAQTWAPPALPKPDECTARGELMNRLICATNRLTQPPYSEEFILADVSFKEKRVFTEYSGDISGRIIGLAATQALCGRPTCWDLNDLLTKLVPYQKPDGHFGAPQNLDQGIDASRDMPILWGNGRMLIGLVEAWNAIHNKEALEMAKKLGDYYVNTDEYYDHASLVHQFGSEASGFQTCYFSGIEGLVKLYQATKDKRYLTQAEKMAQLMIDSSPIGEMHSHGRLCADRGLLDLYEVTKDIQYLNYVIRDENAFRTQYMFPTGGISEMTGRSWNRDEGCSEADWLRLNLRLWRLTGTEMYLDTAEMDLLNEMEVNQFPNGGFGHHVCYEEDGLMDGYQAITTPGTQEAYWCCSIHAPRALLETPWYCAAVQGRKIYVNLYEPVKTELKVGGDLVKIWMDRKNGGSNITLHILPSHPDTFSMAFRIPLWANQFTVTDEDGHPITRLPSPDGRYLIERKWGIDNTIHIHMPYTLSYRMDSDFVIPRNFANLKAPVRAVALYYGPYLLGWDPNGVKLPLGRTFPHVSLSEGRADINTLSVVFPAKGDQPEITFQAVGRLAEEGKGFRLRADAEP
jgi:DUF1680 family protein